VFIVVYFIIDSVRKILHTPSYKENDFTNKGRKITGRHKQRTTRKKDVGSQFKTPHLEMWRCVDSMTEFIPTHDMMASTSVTKQSFC